MNVITKWDGKHYDDNSKHQKEWGNALVKELKLNGNETILDLGCGNGHTTRELAMLVPNGKVFGIDSSPEMLEVAKEECLPNMKVNQEDINELCYTDEFDVIFSNATLHWIHNHEDLITNIYRALKTGGYMRVQFAADGNCSTFVKVIKELMATDKYKNIYRDFNWPWFFPTSEVYQRIVNKLPFKEMRIWTENSDRFFKTETEIIAWIKNPSLIPFMEALREEQQKELQEEVIDKMLTITKQDDGTYFETFRRINVFAIK